MRCFFLFCSLKDFYNFYEVVGLKWKVRVCWVEKREWCVGGREKEWLERSWLRNKGNLREAGDGGKVGLHPCLFFFAWMWLWLLLTGAVLLPGKTEP